jgi:hypothetical protein
MLRHANHGGDSGVVSYEIKPGSIQVEFHDGLVYLYTDQNAGPANIYTMQQLARMVRYRARRPTAASLGGT